MANITGANLALLWFWCCCTSTQTYLLIKFPKTQQLVQLSEQNGLTLVSS